MAFDMTIFILYNSLDKKRQKEFKVTELVILWCTGRRVGSAVQLLIMSVHTLKLLTFSQFKLPLQDSALNPSSIQTTNMSDYQNVSNFSNFISMR